MNNEEKILEILLQMQSDISGLKSDVSGLTTKVGNIESKVDTLQKDMDEVKLNVRFLWEEYERQDKRIDRIAK